jgi:hypothetical protein
MLEETPLPLTPSCNFFCTQYVYSKWIVSQQIATQEKKH